MSRLDPNTIILINTLLCLLLSLVLVMLRRSYPPSVKGLGEWAGAIGFSFLSMALFATRGKAPDFVSMPLAQGVGFVALYMFYRGSEHFLDIKPRAREWLAAICVAEVILTWYSVVRPDYQIYGVWTTGLTGIALLALAALLGCRGPKQFSIKFAVLVALAQAMVSLLSSYVTLVKADVFGPYDPVVVRGIYVASMSLCVMGLGIGFILMATERLRTELELLASHDSLTGALTRRVMADACEAELERFRRMGHNISLIMMDLDHFKKINDTYGHGVGDKVLVDFVQRVKSQLRKVDRLGRFGGEEFVVMLPETSLEAAKVVAERIRAAADAARVEGLPHYTVSIGLAVSQLDDDHVDTILKRADEALYRAKTQGRNRVEAG